MMQCRRMIMVVALSFVVAGAVMTAGQRAGDVALRAAVETETIRGDVKAAIDEYKRLVDTYGRSDRGVAAQALLRLAEAYQKLGDAQATRAYERIVQEFADQKDAVALARRRMQPSARAAGDGLIHRFLKTGRDVGQFSPSPDGRYLAFGNNGNLTLHDVATGAEREITRDSPWRSDVGPAQHPIFTPDGKRIVYATRIGTASEVRVIGVDGTGLRTIARLEGHRYFFHHGISADGKTLSARLGPLDQTWQVAVVTMDSGKVRVLKTTGWTSPWVGNFSADGRWIVYSVPPPKGAASDKHEVYSIAVDGTAEFRIAPAIASPTTPYFSPDGSRVVFVGERQGQRVLWSVRVADGRPIGAPEVVKMDVGAPMGFTTSGSLYFLHGSSRIGVFTAEADPATWKVSNTPKEVSGPFRQSAAVDPVWSPDGTLLAYSVPPDASGSAGTYGIQMESAYSRTTTFVIRDQRSGQERELTGHGGRLRGWSPDGRSLLVDAGPGGVRILDINTGKARALIDRQVGLPAVSVDGNAVFYYERDSGFTRESGTPRPAVETVRVVRRDIGTNEDKELCHLEAARGTITDLSPSPDGTQVAFIALDPSMGGAHLFVASSSGGPLREIQRPRGTLAGGFAWTGDSKTLLFVRDPEESSKGRQVWALPIDGSAPVATGIESGGLYSLSVHPDGHVAFTGSVRETDQVSILDGLFPTSSKN